ncbi:MAG: hypothetical protein ACREV6_14830 [Clostridium sp.]|uniref:hypothetical protein n=1 Tax=Clostridium sp. TaxID=1506 RepID=UPI003D6D88EC
MRLIFRFLSFFIFIFGCGWLFEKINFPSKLLNSTIRNYKYFKLIAIFILASWCLLAGIVTNTLFFEKHYYIGDIVFAIFMGISIAIGSNLFRSQKS